MRHILLVLVLAACGDETRRMSPSAVPAPPSACEPNTIAPCPCANGMGTQRCRPSGTGYYPCFCGTGDVGPIPVVEADAGTNARDAAVVDTGERDAGNGAPPTVGIQHPSDGEMRVAGSDIPFDGSAVDVEDGMLPGSSMTWSSDVDGMLGTGANIRAPLTTLGLHTVTLSAVDSDGNVGQASITLDVVP